MYKDQYLYVPLVAFIDRFDGIHVPETVDFIGMHSFLLDVKVNYLMYSWNDQISSKYQRKLRDLGNDVIEKLFVLIVYTYMQSILLCVRMISL